MRITGARDSAIDRIADDYVDRLAALDPIAATGFGVPGHDTEMPDLSPDGHAARAELDRTTLRALDDAERTVPVDAERTGSVDAERTGSVDAERTVPVDAERTVPVDATDRITLAAMRERLGLRIERFQAGEVGREVNVLSSPAQSMRDVFDLMPSESVEDWATITARLTAVPAAVAGYQAALAESARAGRIPARRQLDLVATQCVAFAAADGYFASMTDRAEPAGSPLPPALRGELSRVSVAAAEAYGELAFYLRALRDRAPLDDACGADRYALASREFLGAVVDQRETYAWGLDQLAGIEAEMRLVARELTGSDDVDAAIFALDEDPARRVHGTDALRAWMQDLSDRTLADLAGTHFDIPAPMRRLDCRIAPTHTGAIYYVAPNEDFTRPGTMWWSVPEGVTDFATWKEVTIVFHEGVPGHHLQCGQTVYRAEQLNRWRRLACWVSGHGEGWALYAERLMSELGHLDDPGARLGMLDSQALRACRVVVDIGVHLGLPAPAEVGGGRWDADKAWTFLRRHTRVGDEMLRFELDRYLGWPGQAPSYLIGQRFWLQLREEAKVAAGDGFDLRAFHRRALDVGSLGLDVLRAALAPEEAGP